MYKSTLRCLIALCEVNRSTKDNEIGMACNGLFPLQCEFEERVFVLSVVCIVFYTIDVRISWFVSLHV